MALAGGANRGVTWSPRLRFPAPASMGFEAAGARDKLGGKADEGRETGMATQEAAATAIDPISDGAIDAFSDFVAGRPMATGLYTCGFRGASPLAS